MTISNMVRYFMKFSYLGSQYRGIQKQNYGLNVRDNDTVQGVLETALRTVYPSAITEPKMTVSSRTDRGVHSLLSTAHVDLELKDNAIHNSEEVLRQMNRFFVKCSHDIRLLNFIPVTKDFHARFSAKSRTYMYRFMVPKDLNNHKYPIIEGNYTPHIREPQLNIERMKASLEMFLGYHDFETFCSKRKGQKDWRHCRRVLDMFILEEAQPLMPFDFLSHNHNYYQFKIKSKSFLYKQVRRMVGTVFALGKGIITEKDIETMLRIPSSAKYQGVVAEPHGLYLLNIEYDPDVLRKCRIET
ncbi:tRNA pseudouridine synthase-like 1 [Prorops nasuta]|uniref:tRNA pseudouridine synthase-like 1 n=1 Tax=Prorops nasuta TaxID=863751 RepID=UPI0034CEE5C9